MKDRKINRHFLFLFFTGILFCGFHVLSYCQGRNADSLPILFYNTENLFDCFDDTLKDDEEFLPDAVRRWNFKRYNDKVNRIAKVILASNGWEPPVLAGLCEVENDGVLKRLVWETGLSEAGYGFIHFESPDKRGIDAALLYRKDKFEVLSDSAVDVSDPDNDFFTRDILYVKGAALSDTFNVFVCHFPSKYGGVLSSEHRRVSVAEKLRSLCDSLLKIDENSRIVIMGDMNESPGEKALSTVLKAGSREAGGSLTNLAFELKADGVKGTVKYRGRWDVLDQIIVSRSLLDEPYRIEGMQVVELPFLLEQDEAYSGVRPFRTYLGPKFHGGFSDHLPVKVVLIKDH